MRATMLFVSLLLAAVSAATAQELHVPPLNGFTAGQEAAARTREEALANISRQIGLNDALRQRAAVAVPALPPGVVARYPAQPVIGWAGPVGVGFAYDYDPWAYAPWDAWRVEIPPWAQVRQPVGQIEIQTAANRWESRPIYAPDAAPAPIEAPPPVAPAPVAPAKVPPPVATPSYLGGPREF